MLVRTAIDHRGLETPHSTLEQRTLHQLLTAKLISYSQPRYSSAADLESFVRAVAELPDSLRAFWEEVALRPQAPFASNRAISEIDQLHVLMRNWAKCVELALVSDAVVESFGVSADSSGMKSGSLEIRRLLHGAGADAFAGVERIRQSPIVADEPVDEVWNLRFRPIAELATIVTVVDGYASAIDAVNRLDDLRAFLRRAATDGVRSVHIITEGSNTSRAAVQSAFTRLRADLPSVEQFDLSLVPRPEFRLHGHARHVRFDELGAVSLDKGLEGFAAERFAQSGPCQWIPIRTAQATERALVQRAMSGYKLKPLWTPAKR